MVQTLYRRLRLSVLSKVHRAENVNHSTSRLANPLVHSSILEVEIGTVGLEPRAVAQTRQTHPHAAAEGDIGTTSDWSKVLCQKLAG